MKSLYYLAGALLVATALVPLSANAQVSTSGYSPDGVVLKKNVVEGEAPNTYTINLETFVTGETIITKEGGPLDVVLVLDFSGSLQGQKWTNLELAVSNFLKSLRDYQTEYSAEVKVGVVSFNSNYATHTIGLEDPTSENITNFISRLDNHEFEPQGSTRIDFGMRQAKQWLDGYGRRDVMKSVVVFTDGQPESANMGEFENLDVAKDAINDAHTIKKDYGAIIYSIGLIPEGDEGELIRSCSDVFAGYQGQTTNISGEYLTTRSFLERISSLYPEASITSTFAGAMLFEKDRVNFGDGWMSPKNEEDTYYQRAETNTLSEIFKNISEKIIGGASYELEESSTTVIDVVSPAFKLPDGADGSRVNLFVAKCTGVESVATDGTVNYTFDPPVEVPNSDFPNVNAKVGILTKTKVGEDVTVTFTEQVDGKAVSVTGFDFSKNFVGKRTTASGISYGGYKLIISFPIEIDPSNPGGATQETNTEDSGIYTDKGDGKGYQQIGGFEIPTVKIPNIVVIKNGLKKGDSAIFNVYKIEGDGAINKFPIVLVATCKEDGQPAIAKTKIQKVGRYMIEETSWSWAYGISSCQGSYPGYEDSSSITLDQWHEKGFGAPGESGYAAQIPDVFGTETTSNSITRNVNDFTEEENTALGYKGTLFIFTNQEKSGNPAHAETYNNNVFFETTK